MELAPGCEGDCIYGLEEKQPRDLQLAIAARTDEYAVEDSMLNDYIPTEVSHSDGYKVESYCQGLASDTRKNLNSPSSTPPCSAYPVVNPVLAPNTSGSTADAPFVFSAKNHPSSLRTLERNQLFRDITARQPTLVIDCDYDEYQDDSETSKLVQQLMYSYGANHKSTRPFQLYITSIGDTLAEKLQRIEGVANWMCNLERRHFMDVLPDNLNVTYLSADAEEVLESVAWDGAYVIGGIVDHNRRSNLARSNAMNLGVNSVKKLLVKEVMGSDWPGSPVLTVNQVVSILVAFAEGQGWECMQRIIPKRKSRKEKRSRGKGSLAWKSRLCLHCDEIATEEVENEEVYILEDVNLWD